MSSLEESFKTQSPFAGEPLTIELKDASGQREGFRIYARHIGPLRAKLADAASNLTTAGLVLAGILYVAALPPGQEILLLITLVAPVLAWPLFRWFWRLAFRTTKIIEIRKDAVTIFGLFRQTSYDRNLPHAFAVLPHDKAQREAEKLDLKARHLARKGEEKLLQKYFQESQHVVFLYVGQRIDIASVYDRKEAGRLRARLAACDAFMEGGRGGGPTITPDEEWHSALKGI